MCDLKGFMKTMSNISECKLSLLLTSTTTKYPLAYYMNSKGIGGKQIIDS